MVNGMAVNIKIAGIWFGDSHPVRIMGVLNLGTESFFKGSIVDNERAAVARAEQMVAEGADLLDLGAMSTAPGAREISIEEETSRLIPILSAIRTAVDVPLSVDTFRSEVAKAALENGADIINDVSAFKKDDRMVEVLIEFDAPAVIMATKTDIGDPMTMSEINDSLRNSIKLAERQGYNTKNIILDPAIGRWVPEKTVQYNLDTIKNLNALSDLERPILVGISRKSFIHEVLDRPDPADRLLGSLSATAIAVYNGAHIVRTHDITSTSDVIKIAEAIRDSNLNV